MSAPRRPSGPIRQHSLQQPPRRQQIRRQRSAEEEKPLQIYSNPIRSRFCGSPKPDIDRPKIRIAWGEQKSKSEEQVEIIARQIPGKLRPPTARSLKTSIRPSISEKATILYTRQELAERLRLAWKQREKNKSNIDIFLAHNTVEERSDSQLSTSTSGTAPPTPLPRSLEKRHQEFRKVENPSPKIITFGNRKDSQSTPGDKNETQIQIKLREAKLEIENEEEEANDDQPMEDDDLSFQNIEKSFFKSKRFSNNQISNHQRSTHQVLSDKSDDVKKIEEKETPEESVVIEKKKSCISIDWTNTTEEIPVPKLSNHTKEDSASVSSAKLKRAGFQGGHNKAFVGPIIEKTMTLKVTDKATTSKDLKFRRTSSAPPIRRAISVSATRTQVNIVIDAPAIKNEFSDKMELKLYERKDTMRVVTSDNDPSIKSTISHRPIKSAPIKRRTKSGKRRGFAIGSKDGDNDSQERSRGRRGGRLSFENRMTDIVTMVSLVSSADSDSDVEENSLRDDKLIHELRNKLPTTPIIKSSTNPSIPNSQKPIKSVSFQQDSFDDDSPPKTEPANEDKKIFLARYSLVSRRNSRPTAPEETTTWKTEIDKLVPPLPSLSQESEEPINIPLTDREKRCLAVPIGDLRDKKRKLLRTRSTPPKPSDMVMTEGIEQSLQIRNLQNKNPQQSPIILTESPVKVTENNLASTTEIPVATDMSAEPPFQTAKEKECWHLYRRMCDKGVFVSFDTVLRGMLTPTEYRLRQKEMSQNC